MADAKKEPLVSAYFVQGDRAILQRALGMLAKSVQRQINTLPDGEVKEAYRKSASHIQQVDSRVVMMGG